MIKVKKLAFLLIVLIFFLTLSGVNAIEDGNATQDLQYQDNEMLSEDIGSFTELQSLINSNNNTIISLEKDFVQNDDEETIVISKPLTINGNGHYIDANNKIQAMTISGNDVTMNNITIKNGNSKSAGAIYWRGSNGILTDSIFINNKATGTDTTSNFEGGGAIFWAGENGLITNTAFSYNTAGGHGGALWWDSSNGLVSNSIFENNIASKWGGSIYWKGTDGNIINSTFTNDSARNGGSLSLIGNNMNIDNLIVNSSTSTLGALYWNVVDGAVKNSKFYNNYNSGSTGGGALYTTSTCNLTSIENCEFVNNTATKSGGAIYAYAKAIVDNCTFINNFALEYGGAIFFNKESSELRNSKFTKNNASKSGGAVYISNRYCIVDNSTFKMNYANYGGGIYFSSYKHELINSLFEDNTVLYDGGAIYIGSYGTVVNNTNFINNSADRGGALYNYYMGSTITTSTIIINSDFKYNNATAGGAIASFSKFIDMNNDTLTFNKAKYGSAIFADRTSFTISNSILLNNSADSVELNLNYDSDDFIAMATFKVNDTLLNAIYRDEGSMLLENVTYWGVNGISNTDNGYIEDNYAINQNVTLLVYNDGILESTHTNQTNSEGSAIFNDLSLKQGNYTLQAIHYKDNYYTEISSNIESFYLDGIYSKLKLVNSTLLFGENALVEVSPDATGTVSIFIGKYYTAEINNGLANISLENLPIGTYGALIIYSGDDYYDGSQYATQIKIITNRPDAYSYLRTEYTNTIQAGINNTLTLFVQNVGEKSGENVKIKVLSEDTQIANFTVENFEVDQYYKFSLIDTLLRPIDNSTVFNVTHNSANYTIIVEDDKGIINITENSFPVIYNGYLGKDYAYPQEFNTEITRVYDVTGDVIIVNSPYTQYASSTSTYRVENFTISYRNNATEALLYVPYNWDTIDDGDYNRWHAVFNNGFITPIAHYRDQGNLGSYGNRGYGLVVYNVTEFVKSGNNIFELTKVRSGCAVYPSSLIVFTKNSLTNTIKRVYISENADLLSKEYSLNSTVGELTKLDSINTNSIISSQLYVFAASAEIDEGNIIFNGNSINNVWNGNSSSLEMFTIDITQDIRENNELFFEATGGTILSLHKMIVVLQEPIIKKDLNISASADPITIGEELIIRVSGLLDASGNVVATIDNEEYVGEINDGEAVIHVNNLTKSSIADITYVGDYNYNNASTTLLIEVLKLNATVIVTSENIYYGDDLTVNVELPSDVSGPVNITVDSELKSVSLNNGIGSAEFSGLAAGSYTVVVSFAGDEKYNEASADISVKVNKATPTISVSAENIDYGEELIVNVELSSDASRRAIVTVDDESKYVSLTNGIGSVKFTGLTAGTHTVTATYKGDTNYDAKAVANTTIKVNKVTPTILITANNINYSEDLDVNVEISCDATRRVIITIDGDDEGAKLVTIRNGTGSVKFSGLSVGTHTIAASYNGDENYKKLSVNKTVKVTRKTADIKITAEPVIYGETSNILIELANATRRVNVTIDGVSKLVSLTDGMGVVEVDGLSVGTHDIAVTYNGDSNYVKTTVNSTVKVIRATPEIQVTANDITAGEALTVDVQLPADVTRRAIVTIDGGESKAVSLKEGIGSVKFTGLEVGTHEIVVSYAGDTNYSKASTTTTIEVKK